MNWFFLLGLFLSVSCLAQNPDDIAGFFADEKQAEGLRVESVRLAAKAHGLLDEGEYQKAEAAHRKSRSKILAAEAIERDVAKQVGTVASNLIDALNAERFADREAATIRLSSLGVRALPFIRPHLADSEPERRVRLEGIVETIGDVTYDEQGRLQQWAVAAKASTEWSNPRWAAQQATGRPNTPEAGDHSTAWAPKGTQVGVQSIELTYRHAVLLHEVGVVETYNPGSVQKLEAMDADGNFQVLWEGKDPTRNAPATFKIQIPPGKRLRTRVLRLSMDTNAVDGYNEIDAVRLNGTIEP